jgi:hypothetical protein
MVTSPPMFDGRFEGGAETQRRRAGGTRSNASRLQIEFLGSPAQ